VVERYPRRDVLEAVGGRIELAHAECERAFKMRDRPAVPILNHHGISPKHRRAITSSLPVWLTVGFVNRALRRQSTWDRGNQVLYDLCRQCPEHHELDEIVAKVWLIGRSYAAALERRRDMSAAIGDDFYVDHVAPTMRKARIDRWLKPLRGLERPDAAIVVPVQALLTSLFEQISGLGKRSLASKYLHFHFPKAVYLFDARAARGIRLVTSAQHLRELPFKQCDNTYARFFLRCAEFHDGLNDLMGRQLSPREVDTVLLAVSVRER
jgi:hypothetical protein